MNHRNSFTHRTLWTWLLIAGSIVALGSSSAMAADKEDVKAELTAPQIWYRDYCQAYLKADWKAFDELKKTKNKNYYKLESAQKKTVSYLNFASSEHRPKWWPYCRSASPKSFRVKIWAKSFTANYKPGKELGFQMAAAYNAETNKLIFLVSWRPELINNPDPFNNDKMEEAYGIRVFRAEAHNFTMGNMAEVIAWHELGHHCISNSFNLDQLIFLYRNHRDLYCNIQELYADMAAMYHASSPARRMAFMFRAQGLVLSDGGDDDEECHNRAAIAMGSLLLSEWLANPKKWPSVHFPGTIPEGKNFEKSLLIYVYRHIAPSWTVEEDIALRKMIKAWTDRYGVKAFRSKGEITQFNRQMFHVLPLLDGDKGYKAKREVWMKTQLKKIIADKGADDPKLFKTDLENRKDERKPKFQREYEKRIKEIRAKREEEEEKRRKKKREDAENRKKGRETNGGESENSGGPVVEVDSEVSDFLGKWSFVNTKGQKLIREYLPGGGVRSYPEGGTPKIWKKAKWKYSKGKFTLFAGKKVVEVHKLSEDGRLLFLKVKSIKPATRIGEKSAGGEPSAKPAGPKVKSISGENVAMFCKPKASKSEKGRGPEAMTDGDTSAEGSLWRSGETEDSVTIDLDMEVAHTLRGFNLYWADGYPTSYTIETSTDGTTFETVATVTGKAGLNAVKITSTKARYIRVTLKKPATKSGYGLYELEALVEDSEDEDAF